MDEWQFLADKLGHTSHRPSYPGRICRTAGKAKCNRCIVRDLWKAAVERHYPEPAPPAPMRETCSTTDAPPPEELAEWRKTHPQKATEPEAPTRAEIDAQFAGMATEEQYQRESRRIAEERVSTADNSTTEPEAGAREALDDLAERLREELHIPCWCEPGEPEGSVVWCHNCAFLRSSIGKWQELEARAHREREERLRQIASEYGGHKPGCARMYDHACNCGWAAIRKEVEG